MLQQIIPILFLALTTSVVLGQESDTWADVNVSATIEQTKTGEAELVVTAKVFDGLHIYAQSQPKPFLATKIAITDLPDRIESVGEFVADRKPILVQHESLGIELHEFEGTVQWRAPLTIRDELATEVSDPPEVLAGTVFAQACEGDRCFAPTTYSFKADYQTVKSVAASNQNLSDDTASFSLSNLQVTSSQTQSAWSVIPLAFVAGFLLNLMPCVLPVVGLKLLSFVQQANADRKQILLMNLAYTAGLLSVMLILATFAVFAGLGWGEQFSSAGFTVTLSAIVFAFGLSFLGVWEIPLPGFIGAGNGTTKQEGYGGAFSKGILSTLLATPCSGPFLGAALAWAVTQPTYLTYCVFAAVGLGMASPYLVVGLFPSMIRFLPKPGNWMVTFKQLMGFVMLATVVYLISFMPIASVVPTVLLMLGIGMAVWYASQTPGYAPAREQVKAWSIATSMVVVTALVSFGWLQDVMQSRFERAVGRFVASQTTGAALVDAKIQTVSENQSPDHIAWKTYSPELFESLVRDGKPVFIDFTADWCLTCKTNEASAIETDAVAAALRESGTVALRADKTESNPAVDELLRKLGNSAASIPFYAIFPANNPSEPILLDGLFSSGEPFVEALTRKPEQSRISRVSYSVE
ncbi:Thiol:disulfide interchange protein DsbD precursor [Rubripirellula obstinata]|uniref:Thiol:disulfide interchange protein DsbD n=1 Tax=Rubripirellula obstinata TaxID=406547 RepID=A0A5B1CQ01_9BACT|nr:thioredoxin family protein [Rubripirellula obstinata]KAA1261294.1 Thiol:disulfide interchange protein DsbD precursor [Rubripirellula obstinata]